MAGYKPKTPFNVPVKILQPTWQESNGVRKKIYPDPDTVNDVVFVSFRTFGGTERESNGLYLIENTATVETWYRPDITSDCQVFLTPTGQIYEVIGEPENIEMRNQFLKFRVRLVGGRA